MEQATDSAESQVCLSLRQTSKGMFPPLAIHLKHFQLSFDWCPFPAFTAINRCVVMPKCATRHRQDLGTGRIRKTQPPVGWNPQTPAQNSSALSTSPLGRPVLSCFKTFKSEMVMVMTNVPQCPVFPDRRCAGDQNLDATTP